MRGHARGRGAHSNHTGRYERERREAFDDGWTAQDPAPPAIDTVITQEAARTIITRNESPDIGFDRSINTYRGCEHGCIYCYARPNHAYAGLSPGLDFESRIFVKANAAVRLTEELATPGYRPAVLMLGGVTDVYQPAERRLNATRAVLNVLVETRHPVATVTKSTLIARDMDLWADLARDRLAKVAVSVTTLDRGLARAMEPRAPTPARRLATIEALAAAGVPVTVMVAPVVPAVNDGEIEAIVKAAADAGATAAAYVALRLPLEISGLFQEWLAATLPDRAARVMSLVRQMRGGRDYDAAWGVRQTGTGPIAALIAARMRAAIARHGLNRAGLGLRTDLFRPPVPPGGQLRLL